MKRMSQKGFTLVELMVVVAIIGILSAIAVPNFKKYKEKAKMVEGRTTLSTFSMGLTNWEMDNNTYIFTANCSDINFVVSQTNKFDSGVGACMDPAVSSAATSVDTTATGITYKNAASGTTAAGGVVGNSTTGSASIWGYVAGVDGLINSASCKMAINEDNQVRYSAVVGSNADLCKENK